MAILLRLLTAYPEVPLAISSFFLLGFLRQKAKDTSPICFPIVGMLPSLLINLHHLHDFFTNLLEEKGCTASVRGPWLSGMGFVLSSDPAVSKYVTSTKFNNFIRGPRFREVLKPLGDGIISSDFDAWRVQRRVAKDLIHQPKFLHSLRRLTHQMLERRLLPALAHTAGAGRERNVVDLQSVLQKFQFDVMCSMILGVDLDTLSATSPVPFAVAVNDAEEAIAFRYVVPMTWWRLLRWLQLGPERRMTKAIKVLDEFIYQVIAEKKEQLSKSDAKTQEGEAGAASDLLTEFIKNAMADGTGRLHQPEKFLRDSTFELLIAGWHSTSVAMAWLIWLVSTHPSVETKILDELTSQKPVRPDDATAGQHRQERGGYLTFDAEELDRCVFLNATIRESLRLFPPAPLNPKCALQQDVLPTGESLSPGNTVILSLYAMGRMERNWGADATEFKPERWISQQGQLREESSYKFGVFGSGPRLCIGKTHALATIKSVAASIIYNFHFSVAEGHEVSPTPSIVLHMKKGLKGSLQLRESKEF